MFRSMSSNNNFCKSMSDIREKLYFYVRCLQIYVFFFFHNICRNLYTYCDIQKRLMIEKKLHHPTITTHIGKLMYLKMWDRLHPHKKRIKLTHSTRLCGFLKAQNGYWIANICPRKLQKYILADNTIFEIKEGWCHEKCDISDRTLNHYKLSATIFNR